MLLTLFSKQPETDPSKRTHRHAMNDVEAANNENLNDDIIKQVSREELEAMERDEEKAASTRAIIGVVVVVAIVGAICIYMFRDHLFPSEDPVKLVPGEGIDADSGAVISKKSGKAAATVRKQGEETQNNTQSAKKEAKEDTEQTDQQQQKETGKQATTTQKSQQTSLSAGISTTTTATTTTTEKPLLTIKRPQATTGWSVKSIFSNLNSKIIAVVGVILVATLAVVAYFYFSHDSGADLV